MKLTIAEIQGTKYVQIYLTKEELEKKETKEIIENYKQEKYSVAIFVSGKENYPEILEKIITKQVELNKNVC
jgi:phosphopantetheine adenylyltransferase